MPSPPNLPELWPSSGKCYLCPRVGPLCRSHIIPKFVTDWLRDTNVTGRLRFTDVPNRLVEDGVWRYLLCAECEALFSRFETEVCETIFLPLHNRVAEHFRYGPEFTRFAVSIAWRSLTQARVEGRLGTLSEMPEAVDAALTTWGEFLLHQRPTPAPFDVHAYPASLTMPSHISPDEVSPHLGRYLLRSMGQGMQCRDGFGYVLVKMARLCIFGTVAAGSQRRIWKGTKLHVSGGAWGVEAVAPGWVFHWFTEGASRMEKTMDGLSDAQKQRTHDELMELFRADPDALLNSGAGQGWRADMEMFGRRAMQKPFKKG
jgi:hypothetical protein